MRLVVFERRSEGRGRRRHGASDFGHSMGAAALGFETLEGVTQGARRIGVLLDAAGAAEAVVDLNRALAVKLAAEDAGAPEAEADSLLPPSMGLYLRRLPDSQQAAQEALSFVARSLGSYDAPDLEAAGVVEPRRAVRLAAPVQQPGKVVSAVAGEDGEPPLLFLVAPSALGGPEDDVLLHADAEPSVDAQIAAVIGRRMHRVPAERALEGVAGYCAALRLRADGEGAPPGTIRYSGDGFVPIGPALVTRDDAPDPGDLRIELRVSGRRLQTRHTKELPLPMHELIARASQLMTLEPGDVVLSGPPRGGDERPGRLRDGDVVEAEVERLGRLSVYLRAERDGSGPGGGSS